MHHYWLIKSDSDTYPIDELKKDKKTPWSGVRNFLARNYMRDQMHVGDLCLFYHSGDKEKGIAGIAKVASMPYPDPGQFEKKDYHFDPKSTREKPIWILVDIAFVKKFKDLLSLAEMKVDPMLSDMTLFRANRLSIQPVSEKHFNYIVEELAQML